jgi:hypothetical protein
MIVLLLASVLAASPPAETITYHVTACLGSSSLHSNRIERWASHLQWREVCCCHRRSFRVIPSEFEAFRARLAPYRPKQGRGICPPRFCSLPRARVRCPSIEIMWSSDSHPDQRLDYYDGCLNPKVPPEMWVRWCIWRPASARIILAASCKRLGIKHG